MFMMASRNKKDGKPYLKLNIYEFEEGDIPFLDKLGIVEQEVGQENVRYTLIHSQEDFFKTRSQILERYDAEEKGPRVFLTLKSSL